MINLEKEYRRFQDFGLIIGSAVVVALIACVAKIAVGHSPSLFQVLRIVFYATLAWNIASLRHCYSVESPVAGLPGRSRSELIAASTIIVLVTIVAGGCFELI